MNEVTPEQVVQFLLLQAKVYPHMEDLLATAATLIDGAYTSDGPVAYRVSESPYYGQGWVAHVVGADNIVGESDNAVGALHECVLRRELILRGHF